MAMKIDNIEYKILNKYDKYTIQLYKALNRQYNKEDAIKVVVNFILKKLGYRALYLDIIEKSKKIMIKESSSRYINERINASKEIDVGVFELSLPIDKYKNQLYLEDYSSIKQTFPLLNKTINPYTLLSTPVFSQNKLMGVLLVYDKEKHRSMPHDFRESIQLIARELTAVFSRIERQNLNVENVLGMKALEHILLSSIEDSANTEDPLEQIVSVIGKSTDMKRCSISLIDQKGKYLLPHYSNFDDRFKLKEIRYPLDKSKTEDHTGIIALETKKPVIVYDALTDPRCDPKISKKLGIRSSITLPIINIHGDPMGVIYLDNEKYEAFSKRQVGFFQIVSRYIGLIISNMEYIGKLKTWSKHDGLTGLLNRRAFQGVYNNLYNNYRFTKNTFSILMVDIDNFKLTNDTYGHQVGDKILKGIANCIQENVREQDIVARYGGEEIIIILKDIGKNESKVIAERIRNSIESFSLNGIGVTVSIGTSTFGVDSYNKENLIYIADKCLYNAKNRGKNQVAFKN